MAQKYITLSEKALDRLLGLVRESHSVAEGIDDENIATNSTYSSLKIQELLGEAGATAVELTKAEYDALSEEEKKNGTIYFITDVDNEGGIIGYIGGTGITVSEDKVIAIKDIKKNYIDNSNFRINTRSQSEYTTSDSSIYTVDRWYIDGGILTLVENGVQFTNTNTLAGASSLVRLKQDIPYTFVDLAGKTLTLSAKINGTIYSGSATLPSEKPTEGTAIQYIAVGIPAFGINLNYSITGDYFVPYLALAYTQSILIEWMKLEVNDEFSGYIEPDYMTEKIKLNYMSDNGKLSLPYADPLTMEIVALESLTIPASSEKSTTIDISKEGYKPLFATINTTGNAKCFCYALRITEAEELNAGFHNSYNAELTITPQVQVVYKKI